MIPKNENFVLTETKAQCSNKVKNLIESLQNELRFQSYNPRVDGTRAGAVTDPKKYHSPMEETVDLKLVLRWSLDQ